VKRFWILSAILVATAVILALLTPVVKGLAPTSYLGMPVVGWGKQDTPCWIAMGGQGVVVLGAGVGLVEYGVFGVGLLFACGQAAAGLIAFGQAAFGLIFVCAQLGLGLSGVGQLFIGGWGIGQGRLAANGEALLKHLDRDLDDILRFTSAPDDPAP
jgi:hypothetical protein